MLKSNVLSIHYVRGTQMNRNETLRKKVIINPPGTEEIYKRMKFSQAVRIDDVVWVSGQVGIDENGIPDSICTLRRHPVHGLIWLNAGFGK